ncbi:MAG: hypothetical protein RLZZ436_556 [Planctomycetota bacterium]
MPDAMVTGVLSQILPFTGIVRPAVVVVVEVIVVKFQYPLHHIMQVNQTRRFVDFDFCLPREGGISPCFKFDRQSPDHLCNFLLVIGPRRTDGC